MNATTLARPNPSSGAPVYLQLVDQVKRQLETGALQPGEVFPEVLPLAEALVVHPACVTRAYGELERLSLAVRTDGALRASVPTTTGRARHDERARSSATWTGLSRELETARDVQRCLLPKTHPAVDGLDYAGWSRAARGVTGDYYDFVPLPDGRLAVAVGDVCGKGVPAALVMAALRAYLRGATVQHQADPRALVTMTNDLLYESVPTGRFATLFYGVYDPASRTLEYVNAGHLPPMLIRNDNGARRLQRLETGGVATGLMPGAQYASERIRLEPGDRLVAFTDGITEALNADGEEWGEDQLIALLESSPQSDARGLADAVHSGVDDFARGTSQYDDMTVAVLQVM